MNTQHVKQLAKEVAKMPPSKKPITLVKEEVTLADGGQMKPLPVKNGSDVLRVSLLMLFKHVSDIHVSLVEIVAEKFGIPVEEIHKAVTEDPRWTQMLENPLITDLTSTIDENSVKPSGPAKLKKPRAPRKKKTAPPQPKEDEELVFTTEDDDVLVFNTE
jgi:hypothetical protein